MYSLPLAYQTSTMSVISHNAGLEESCMLTLQFMQALLPLLSHLLSLGHICTLIKVSAWMKRTHAKCYPGFAAVTLIAPPAPQLPTYPLRAQEAGVSSSYLLDLFLVSLNFEIPWLVCSVKQQKSTIPHELTARDFFHLELGLTNCIYIKLSGFQRCLTKQKLLSNTCGQ